MSQNLMWGLLPPAVPRTLKLLCVLKVLGMVKQHAKFQHRISMHHAVMRICISHRLSIACAQEWVFGSFAGEYVKILCSNPQKALPCVNTCPLVYRVSKSVQRLVSISAHHRSRHVILYQSPKFYPNRTTLGRKNDVMSIFMIASQPSWIVKIQ